MKTVVNSYGFAGFACSATGAILQKWSLPEFCWSTWLAGLVYTWVCILTALVHILLTARSDQANYAVQFPWLGRIPTALFFLGITVLSTLTAFVAFRLFTLLFGFYGLFLSVFAEMEPVTLFGRNGFINSDFFTPVSILVDRFWPMLLGIIVANWRDFIGPNPWKRILIPLQKEVLQIHLMVLALPFFSLLAWALFKEAYAAITVVALMGLLYLLPKRHSEKATL